MNDHTWHGTYFKHYKTPPGLPSQEEIATFADGLESTINLKLDLLAERLNQLNQDRDNFRNLIDLMVTENKIDAKSEYFWRVYYSAAYTEAFYVQKWMRYWLNLKRMLYPQLKREGEITRDEIEYAKSRDITTFYSGQLKGYGNRLTGLCPFHEENTPSFVVYPEQNSYHCYGCGANGDVIEFVMQSEGLTFKDAIRRLQ